MSAGPNTAKAVFLEAVEQHAPDQWPAFLDRACAGEPELRRRVEALLAAHQEIGSVAQSEPDEADRPGAATTITEPPPVPESAGDFIGPYKLLEPIGEGGFGVVFLAEQTEPVRRKVALKVLKPGMDTRQVVARFEAERQALALMDHPNIAKVFDGGETPSGRSYFVMELVNGVPITNFCDQNQLPPRQRLELFVSVCQAVQHAHQKGIIHRDLKPSNVLVSRPDSTPVVKVIDFGIAKALGQELTDKTVFSGAAQILGTPLYMSPEQAGLSGQDVDTRSDIYALGVLLYELLTGTTPFDRRRFKSATYDEVRRIIREEEPPRPSMRLSELGRRPSATGADGPSSLASLAALRQTDPAKLTKLVRGDLDWIVMKCLEKDRNRRYETANGLALDLHRYLADEPVAAGPPSAAYRLRKFVRRHRVAVLTGLAILVSVVTGAAVAAWQAVEARRAEAAALTALTDKEEALVAEKLQRDRAEAQTRVAEAAREAANASNADTQAFSEFLVEDVLSVARPKGDRGGLGIHVTVKAALDAAAANLEKRFRDRPRAEALARHDLGVTYRLIGELEKSEAHFRRALELRTRALGRDDKDTLNTANSLGVLCLARGKYGEAEPLLVQALEGFRRLFGEEDEVTLSCMGNLALVYRKRNRPAEARALLVKVLETRRRVFGETYEGTLSAASNLAHYDRTTGRSAEARKLLIPAADVSRRLLGEEHPLTLTITNNLGAVYLAQGEVEKAARLLVNVLETRRRVLGEDHHETLQSMNDVAMLRFRQGRFTEAEALHQQALEGRRRVLGDAHPDVLDSMNNLAGVYHGRGALAQAEPLLVQVVDLSTRLNGPDAPDTVDFLNNLAGLYFAQGKRDRAEPILVKAVEGLRKTRGEKHVHTIVAMGNLGALYRTKRDFARAEAQLLATLEISRKALGEDDSDTLSFVEELKLVYEDQGQFSRAEALCRESLDALRRRRGVSPLETASALASLGLNLLAQKKFADAETVLRECLTIREKDAADEWRTFSTRSMLGACLLGQKKLAEAEPLLLSGHEGMKQRLAQIPPPAKVRFTESLQRLAQLYEAMGQPEKATEWRKKLAETGPANNK